MEKKTIGFFIFVFIEGQIHITENHFHFANFTKTFLSSLKEPPLALAPHPLTQTPVPEALLAGQSLQVGPLRDPESGWHLLLSVMFLIQPHHAGDSAFLNCIPSV